MAPCPVYPTHLHIHASWLIEGPLLDAQKGSDHPSPTLSHRPTQCPRVSGTRSAYGAWRPARTRPARRPRSATRRKRCRDRPPFCREGRAGTSHGTSRWPIHGFTKFVHKVASTGGIEREDISANLVGFCVYQADFLAGVNPKRRGTDAGDLVRRSSLEPASPSTALSDRMPSSPVPSPPPHLSSRRAANWRTTAAGRWASSARSSSCPRPAGAQPSTPHTTRHMCAHTSRGHLATLPTPSSACACSCGACSQGHAHSEAAEAGGQGQEGQEEGQGEGQVGAHRRAQQAPLGVRLVVGRPGRRSVSSWGVLERSRDT